MSEDKTLAETMLPAKDQSIEIEALKDKIRSQEKKIQEKDTRIAELEQVLKQKDDKKVMDYYQ